MKNEFVGSNDFTCAWSEEGTRAEDLRREARTSLSLWFQVVFQREAKDNFFFHRVGSTSSTPSTSRHPP